MSDTTAKEHRAEVDARQRFEFGKNWRRFLSTLTDKRIALAEASLVRFLGQARLEGKTFLDVGSGSGLFSLVARRLGARVHSFDFDTESVACTGELRRRYFPNDPNWKVEQASVLDTTYLSGLEQFDIVYSWGVLHHTSQMWPALQNVKPLVKPGGQLFIAIYNELGAETDDWRQTKTEYNAKSPALRLPYALKIVAREELPGVKESLRQGKFSDVVKAWNNYDVDSTRGMSKWHDWIDWIGGYPYETAKFDEIVDFYNKSGFSLANGVHRIGGYGCNEFVFRRVEQKDSCVDELVGDANIYPRRFGRAVRAARTEGAYGAGLIDAPLEARLGEKFYLFEDDTLVSAAEIDGLKVSWDAQKKIGAGCLRVAPGVLRKLSGPFQRSRGNIWVAELPELAKQADNAGVRSTIALFHNQKQLAYPHSSHNSIARYEDGRYSHWGEHLLFVLPKAQSPEAAEVTLEILYRADE